jgi:formylglycine-generating enzyme
MKVTLFLIVLIIPLQFSYSQDAAGPNKGNIALRNSQAGIPSDQAIQDSTIFPEMVFIKGGTFQMGGNESGRDTKPVHAVTLTNYYIGKYEITVAQFGQFINETGYQTDADKGDGSFVWTGSLWAKLKGVNWKCNPEGKLRPAEEFDHPVIFVSWNDAVEYCKWLILKTGREYRLPTEAEWEYAAGNGPKHTKYSWGNGEPYGKKGGNVADESSKEKTGYSWPGYNDGYVYTAPVGSFNPNELGLYDMNGNVSEWCSDFYDSKYYKSSPSDNPKGPSTGTFKVIRGGSYRLPPNAQLVIYRDRGDPLYRYSATGFRIVMPEK